MIGGIRASLVLGTPYSIFNLIGGGSWYTNWFPDPSTCRKQQAGVQLILLLWSFFKFCQIIFVSFNVAMKQMCCDNQDVMGKKPVKNDAGQLSLDEEAKKERLPKVELPWNT